MQPNPNPIVAQGPPSHLLACEGQQVRLPPARALLQGECGGGGGQQARCQQAQHLQGSMMAGSRGGLMHSGVLLSKAPPAGVCCAECGTRDCSQHRQPKKDGTACANRLLTWVCWSSGGLAAEPKAARAACRGAARQQGQRWWDLRRRRWASTAQVQPSHHGARCRRPCGAPVLPLATQPAAHYQPAWVRRCRAAQRRAAPGPAGCSSATWSAGRRSAPPPRLGPRGGAA